MKTLVLVAFFATFQHSFGTGQLLSVETRRNHTECAYASFSLDCGSDIIAVESVLFAYRAGCDSTCCTFDSTDCFINPADVSELSKRTCSGESSCNMDLSGSREFCTFGPEDPSYVTAYYYCIPRSRITSICSSNALSSDGRPLYITSEHYPGLTTGNATCSCSVEVYDCSANINIYILDADMYLDTNVCEQSIQITDGASTSLKEINCESYYGSAIEWDTLSTHYLKIKFLDQSTQNQEGYFLLGFAVSDSSATFSLSCTSETESWCIDCGSLPTISFGRLQLIDGSNSGYDAKAQIVCDLGYEAEISTIKCLANATWEDSAVCSVKDCGTSFAINFGNATLNDVSNSAYGATATVTCDHGYNATKETITCAETGSWDTAECEPVDCGSLPTISFGRLQLIDGSNSGYDAKAQVVCDLGYEAELSTIKCLANATWEDSAVCSVKDCGTSFVINYGNVMLNEVSNSTYGATATVTCDHGYTATKETITCAETGSWDTAECKPVGTDGSNEEDHLENTDESRVKDGGLAPGIIAAIAIASILVAIVVVIVVAILHAKCSKSQDISPVSDEKEVPLHKQTTETVQRQVMSRKESNVFSNRKPLPEITKQHEISHGHVYIDHGEAHIFGITIHLPFGNKRANRLAPITRD